MKPKRTLSGYALLVGVLSLSVVGGALIYGIYSALVKTQVTTATVTLIRPLDGQIDPTTLDGLQGRRRFTQAELAVQIVQPTPSPTEETVFESPEAEITPASEITEPEITPEAEITPTEETNQL